MEGGLGCVVEDEDAEALLEELQHGVAADVAGPELRQSSAGVDLDRS